MSAYRWIDSQTVMVMGYGLWVMGYVFERYSIAMLTEKLTVLCARNGERKIGNGKLCDMNKNKCKMS